MGIQSICDSAVSGSRQRGVTTIVIAILLLAILSVVTLFALSVGVFEQRTVGNENRARIIGQAAEAGLNQAVELVKANSINLSRSWITLGRWQRCARLDTTFPCGVESSEDRRETLFRYVENGQPVLLTESFAGGVDDVGAFSTTYQVGALFCQWDMTDADLGVDPTCRVPLDASFSGPFAVTLVSRGEMTGEEARATVKATVGSYRILNAPPEVPIITSGAVDLSGGTADIVPNPNAGGVGVALSVWSGGDADFGGTGAIKSCHFGEFLINQRGGGNAPEVRPDPDEPGFIRCDNCACDGLDPGKGLLSGKYTGPGAGVGRAKNYDILDVVGGGELPPTTYFPSAESGLNRPDIELDDSLFEYVFGVNYLDYDGERLPDFPKNAEHLYPDEVFLIETARRLNNCASLGRTSSGLLWITGACSLPRGDIGSPTAPVLIIVDGDVDLQANTVVFGLIFVRRPAADSEVGAVLGLGSYPPSRTAEPFFARGGSVIYGSVVVEGAARLRGSPTIVYNEAVLRNITDSPPFLRFGLVPGSWTDITPPL